MGKVATNEAIKLRATYYNNLAVGVFVGGVFIPYFAFVQRMSEFDGTMKALMAGTAGFENADVKRLAAFVLALALAIFASVMFRFKALATIAKLED